MCHSPSAHRRPRVPSRRSVPPTPVIRYKTEEPENVVIWRKKFAGFSLEELKTARKFHKGRLGYVLPGLLADAALDAVEVLDDMIAKLEMPEKEEGST